MTFPERGVHGDAVLEPFDHLDDEFGLAVLPTGSAVFVPGYGPEEVALAVDAERHGADPHAIVLALHQRLDLGRLSNRRCNHDGDARAVDNDVEGLGQIVGSLLDERLAARLGHLVHIEGDSFVNLRSPDARHMDAGDLNRRFVGTQVLEVILDKVGIAVRTQLEAVGDLAVGPEDVIFLAHDDRSVLRERNAEINESRNGRVRDDEGAECCLRGADGERGGEDGSGEGIHGRCGHAWE